MSLPPNEPPRPAFWACPRCKTPNPWASYLTTCVGCGEPRPPAEGRAAFVPKPKAPTPKAPAAKLSKSLSWTTGILSAFVVLTLILIRTSGDSWRLPTLLIFTPRWLCLLPFLVLVPWCARRRQYVLLAINGVTTLIVLGPLMGGNLPIGTLFASSPRGERVRIMTLNRSQGKIDVIKLATLIEREAIQIVCFQEGPPEPVLDAYFAKGWHIDVKKKLYSRWPLVDVIHPKFSSDYESKLLASNVTIARVKHPRGIEFGVACCYLPSLSWGLAQLRSGDLDGFDTHLAWRHLQAREVLEVLETAAEGPLLIGGDLNLVADSPLLGPFRSRFQFAFDQVGWGFGYTVPSAAPGVRIDHIFASSPWTFTRCWVGPAIGSDHRPLIAEAVLSARMPQSTP